MYASDLVLISQKPKQRETGFIVQKYVNAALPNAKTSIFTIECMDGCSIIYLINLQ